MSKPGIIYRLLHQCSRDLPAPNTAVYPVEVVDIYDTDNQIDDADPETIIDLIPSGDPVICDTRDNSEDPFTVIKGQRLTIRFNSESPITMETFASGQDNRWQVHNYIDDPTHGNLTLFKGYLVLDDIREAFMPETNVVILTAVDGLGLLKEIPWVDFQDENPVGPYRIAEILAMCLRQTGHDLTLKAAFNIKPSGFVSDISIPNNDNEHFFDRIYLDAISFEDEIGTSISCFEVIERILGEEACLFQRQGFWWVMRIDEIEHPTRGLYVSTFDETGAFIENLGEQNYTKEIGKDFPYTIFFSREATEVNPSRPLKSLRIDYPYDYPKEIVPNIDFSRGDLLNTVSPTEKEYLTDNWIPLFSNTSSDDAPTTDIYIRKIFDSFSYETDRYLVIEQKTGDLNFVMSDPVWMSAKDRFELSLDRRFSANIGGSGFFRDNHIQVRLYANDGTYYTHQSPTSASLERKWVSTDPTFRTNQKFFSIEGDLTNNLTESTGLYDGTSAELPKDGHIRILLYQSSLYGDTVDTYFSNVSLRYRPYFFEQLSGQYQIVHRDESYKAKRETTAYVSDSPRRLFKGAFLLPLDYVEIFSGSVQFFATTNHIQISGYKLATFRRGQLLNISGTASNNIQARVLSVSYSVIGTLTAITLDRDLINETDATTTIEELTFELANEFYNAAVFPSGPSDSTYIHPYSEIQVFDVWNQFYYDKRIFEATCQGLNLSIKDSDNLANNAHLIHKWSLTDTTPHTMNKFFQLLTFDQNHRNGEWKGTFREVYDTTKTKVYTNREFKYVS